MEIIDDMITTTNSNTIIDRLSSTCMTQNITLIFAYYYTRFSRIKKTVLKMGAAHLLVKFSQKRRSDYYVFAPDESKYTIRNV